MNLAETRTLEFKLKYELYCLRLAEAKLDDELFAQVSAAVRRLAQIPTQVEVTERRRGPRYGRHLRELVAND